MDKTVEVTQADRDAAADMGSEIGWSGAVCARVRAGELDYWPTIQAFARHRSEASSDKLAVDGGGAVENGLYLLDSLARAEANYRHAHDAFGAGDTRTGRAWDVMRRAGDRARQALERIGR